ncbi:MAG: hypothetical protein ABI594_04465 [Ginsengibacter sp.]
MLLFFSSTCFSLYSQSFQLKFTGDSIPVIFGPGYISDGFDNRDMAISPGNDELFTTLQYGNSFSGILYSKKINGLWSMPQMALFSGRFNDLEPAFSPDGKKLFFTSNRPLRDTGNSPKDYDIWYIEKEAGNWSSPKNMGPVINSEKDEFYASVTNNGNLYFTRDNDSTADDIFFSAYKNGSYLSPVALDENVNSKGLDFNCFIDPQERFIIYSSYKRSDDMGSGDLYISINKNGKWQPALNLGAGINSTSLDYSPFISFDKKYFFFTSRRSTFKFPLKKPVSLDEIHKILNSHGNRSEDIYIMSAKFLDKFLK